MTAGSKMVLSSQKACVLIVDDNRTSRRSASLILAKDSYHIHAVDSARAMFNYLDETIPDVILLDAMMPDMDGFTACQRCKQSSKLAHIPIIMVTGLTDPNTLTRAIDAGADDFVGKPVQAIELRARVRSAIRVKRQFDALQQSIELRDQLSNILVHDMRNPLQAMSLHADIGRRVADHPRAVKAFDLVKSKTDDLQALVNDMLTAARIEHGQLALTPERVNVGTLGEKALQRIEPLAEDAQLALSLNVEAISAEISADRRLLERVLDNLLSNALKYAPTQSKISVCIRDDFTDSQRSIAIDVCDEGAGIPLAEQEQIFDKFAIGSVRSQRGTRFGLGLPFCKLVVEAHDGQLLLTNNLPRGSIFTVVLPLAESVTEAMLDPINQVTQDAMAS